MNIRLSTHSEQLIKEQIAQGHFHSPEEVIERALETLADRSQHETQMSLEDFDAALDALAEGSERLPILPPDATSRAAIYRDHP
jgi:Arc/MetJ-type ribon-helix-helix transcriptional regulator